MKKDSVNWAAVISISISVAAVVIAFISLYLVEFEPADVQISPAERIGFGYRLQDQSLIVAVPCVVSNQGARPSIIHKYGSCNNRSV